MHPEVKEEFKARRLQVVLDLAAQGRNIRKLCKEYQITRSTYYYWKKRYASQGKDSLCGQEPTPKSSPRKTRPEVADKVLTLRRQYNMGPMKIVYYLPHFRDR